MTAFLTFIVAAIVLLTGATRAAAQPPTPPSPWEPPIGIPSPTFGITETAGAVTISVTCPGSGIPSTLRAGDVVEVHGDCAGSTITAEGTAERPVFIRGSNAACTSGQMVFRGSYLIAEQITFDNCRVVAGERTAPVNHFALRRSIVRNYSPQRNSSAISPNGTHIVIFANEIHNNGDSASPVEIDIHGIKPDSGSSYIWYVDNHVHHNGGDAIQIGDAASKEPWVHHVFVGRNTMHEDREEAVDIKRARDVIVSENVAYGYVRSSTSRGGVAVAHDKGEWIWFIANTAHSSAEGFVSTGSKNYFVVGNLLYNLHHAPHDAGYNPASHFAEHAIHTRGTTNSVIVNNTIWDVDAGIRLGDPGVVVNNLIGKLAQPSHHVAFASTVVAAEATFSNNLFVGSPTVQRGSSLSFGLGGCRHCLNPRDPGIIDPAKNDYRIRPDSAAVDAGAEAAVYAIFETRYQAEFPGLTIARDRAGAPRPIGGWDIGAFESTSSAVKPPKTVHGSERSPE
jgi:hypothetical protein